MPRGLWFVSGAVRLFVYGAVVNLPGWDFGRLLGVYVALLFVAAQVISYFAFSQIPTMPILVGGAFIVIGGLIMTFWQGVAAYASPHFQQSKLLNVLKLLPSCALLVQPT